MDIQVVESSFVEVDIAHSIFVEDNLAVEVDIAH